MNLITILSIAIICEDITNKGRILGASKHFDIFFKKSICSIFYKEVLIYIS